MLKKTAKKYYNWHIPDYRHSIKVSARDNYAFIRFKKIKFLYLNTQITNKCKKAKVFRPWMNCV